MKTITNSNIYEVDEVEGLHFIAMEYVESQTLKERLEGGPLSLEEANQLSSEIADALEMAHQKGIVHRDLKPANIMLTPQGHAKVMDFGLAKRVVTAEGTEQDLTTGLTQEGSTLGTPAYMSPEQVRARPVDHRTDIFLFGNASPLTGEALLVRSVIGKLNVALAPGDGADSAPKIGSYHRWRIMMVTLRLIAILIIGLVSTAWAGNWPTWRGPSGTAVSTETGLPVHWSDTENIAWKAPIRGLGISSPIVWGERVFVTSQLGGGESRRGPRLFQAGDAATAGERALGGGASNVSGGSQSATFLVTAFDRTTGEQVWEYQLASEGLLAPVHEKHNLASSSPVTDGRRVYAWFGTGQLVAVEMNGQLAWKENLATEHGAFDIQWGHGSSPALYRDTLILLSYQASNGYLLALDSASGEVRWKVPAPKGVISYSTPCIVETSGSAEILVNSSEGLAGHDISTGERLWFIKEANRFPVPTAVQHDGIIYTSRGYRSGPFMAIRPGGRGEISKSHVLWKVETGAPYTSSIIFYDGLVYMVGDVGVATVADGGSGRRVWQQRIDGVYTASPVAGDGKVYLLSEDGTTTVLSAGRSPRILARNKLTARQLASPAVAEGRLFIRSDDTLFAIGK